MKLLAKIIRKLHRCEEGPDNPDNGHPWCCHADGDGCFTCTIFWDTRKGDVVYEAWRSAEIPSTPNAPGT